MYRRSISICIVDLGKSISELVDLQDWGWVGEGLLLWVIVCNLGFLQLEEAVGKRWGLLATWTKKGKNSFHFPKSNSTFLLMFGLLLENTI